MSIWSRLFGAPTEPAGKPTTYASTTVGGKNLSYFDERGDMRVKYRTIFNQGGLVSEAILAYPLYCLTNGYRLEGDSESQVKDVQDVLDMIDLESLATSAIIDALVVKAGVQEILGTKGGGITGLVPRPGESFDRNTDEFGNLINFTQTVYRQGQPVKIIVAPEKVFWLDLQLPLIERAYDDILRDTKITEATAEAIERHGFPRYHIGVGQPGEAINDSIMKDVGKQFQNLKPKHEWATTADVKIENIDNQGVPNANEYANWSVQRLTTALGVPEEILGLGRGSTEATANVRLQAFYDKIGAIQKRVARAYNMQILDRITGVPGAVKIVFNDVSPVDEGMKADFLVKIMQANPSDPFWCFSPEYARDYLDIDDPNWVPPAPLEPVVEKPAPEKKTAPQGEINADNLNTPEVPVK